MTAGRTRPAPGGLGAWRPLGSGPLRTRGREGSLAVGGGGLGAGRALGGLPLLGVGCRRLPCVPPASNVSAVCLAKFPSTTGLLDWPPTGGMTWPGSKSTTISTITRKS